MNTFGGPLYQLTTQRQHSVTPVDGIKVHVAEVYRLQSVKMPEYSRFTSNVLTLPANDYNFKVETSVLTKYEKKEKEIAKANASETPAKQLASTVSNGELLRPSVAASNPGNNRNENTGVPNTSANEWADFEQSRDLFDDLELKSIDDRHELARMLDSSVSKESSQPPASAPSGNASASSLTDEYKKISVSDNNLSAKTVNNPSPVPVYPNPPPGPFYASASELSLNPSNSTCHYVRGLSPASSTLDPLTTNQQSAVNNTAGMGFDRDLCSRLAHDLEINSGEALVNAVLIYSSFVAAGHHAQQVERAVILAKGDEKNARFLLEASSKLSQYGFSQDQIYAAYIQLYGENNSAGDKPNSIDELSNKLLDALTASP